MAVFLDKKDDVLGLRRPRASDRTRTGPSDPPTLYSVSYNKEPRHLTVELSVTINTDDHPCCRVPLVLSQEVPPPSTTHVYDGPLNKDPIKTPPTPTVVVRDSEQGTGYLSDKNSYAN